MRPIHDDPAAVEQALAGFADQTVYVHAECIPGGFVRNARLEVISAQLRGDGRYRVALRGRGDAWVRVEDLTHWEIDTQGRLLLLAFGDAEQRLSRTLELSLQPFPA